jgi:subtilisin family serine protease
MSETYKSYTVTAHDLDDTKSLYVNLTREHEATETIPDRLVEVADQRKVNEINTDYFLTDEEAQALRQDPRVVDVTDNSIKRIGRFAFQDSTFNKTTTETGEKSNWGLLRHIRETNVFGTSNNDPGGTYDYVLDGTGVDVVVVDSGIQADHPEFQDANGQSRVQQINWFTASGVSGTMPNGFYTDYDGHGTHVAGTVAGKTFGWAKNAHIYSIKLAGLEGPSDPNSGISDSQTFDCILGWHNAKTNGRRTVVINSWGYIVLWDTAQQALTFNETTYYPITGGVYRGTSWSGSSKDVSKGHTGQQIAPTKFVLSYPISSTDADIAQLVGSGVVVCNAAGNSSLKQDVFGGPDYENYIEATGLNPYYYHRGGSPHARDGYGFQVGSMGLSFVSSTEAKSSYSDSGPAVTVYAAGDRIISSMSNTNIDGTNYAYHLDSNFKQQILSGTSMAAPQIGGLCALLLQAHPDWSVYQIYNWILSNSKAILHTTGSNSDYSTSTSVHGGPNTIAYFSMNGRKVYEISGS